VIRAALGPVGGEFLRSSMEWVEYMRHVSDWEVKQLPRILLIDTGELICVESSDCW
jgi:hypothetical protein